MKTYNTRRNAEHAVTMVLIREQLGTDPGADYVIVAQPGGRFHPVIYLNPSKITVARRITAETRLEDAGFTVMLGELPPAVSNRKEPS